MKKPLIVSFLWLSLLFLLTSCSFNMVFHNPDHYSGSIEDLRFFWTNTDTTFVEYDTIDHQITLLDSCKTIINNSYSVNNMYFDSQSGNKLNGWMLTPTNKKALGTILHFHGSAKSLEYHYKMIAPLAELGYQIFTFDYSGYGYSEGKANRENALADAYSALDYLQTINDISDGPFLIYGHSYGGYLAALVGSEEQDKIDALVIEGAFSSHRDEATSRASFIGNIVKKDIAAREEIKKYHKPLLIIHSREDETVPFKLGQRIYSNANEPKEFYEVDKAHIQALQYYSQEIFDKINAML